MISLFLILLVLVQLPKKEAGLGTAFGGGTTDALFGAGAGNVLTQLTKYSTILFLVLCLVLSIMNKADGEKTNTAGGDKEKGIPGKQNQPVGTGGEVPQTNPSIPIGPAPNPNPETTPSPSEATPSTTPEPVPSTTPETNPGPTTDPNPAPAPAPAPATGEEKKN